MRRLPFIIALFTVLFIKVSLASAFPIVIDPADYGKDGNPGSYTIQGVKGGLKGIQVIDLPSGNYTLWIGQQGRETFTVDGKGGFRYPVPYMDRATRS